MRLLIPPRTLARSIKTSAQPSSVVNERSIESTCPRIRWDHSLCIGGAGNVRQLRWQRSGLRPEQRGELGQHRSAELHSRQPADQSQPAQRTSLTSTLHCSPRMLWGHKGTPNGASSTGRALTISTWLSIKSQNLPKPSRSNSASKPSTRSTIRSSIRTLGGRKHQQSDIRTRAESSATTHRTGRAEVNFIGRENQDISSAPTGLGDSLEACLPSRSSLNSLTSAAILAASSRNLSVLSRPDLSAQSTFCAGLGCVRGEPFGVLKWHL
jgi:hypothetical protein